MITATVHPFLSQIVEQGSRVPPQPASANPMDIYCAGSNRSPRRLASRALSFTASSRRNADTLHEEGVSVNTIRIRFGHESLDVTVAYRLLTSSLAVVSCRLLLHSGYSASSVEETLRLDTAGTPICAMDGYLLLLICCSGKASTSSLPTRMFRRLRPRLASTPWQQARTSSF